jgi:hypothetical protein
VAILNIDLEQLEQIAAYVDASHEQCLCFYNLSLQYLLAEPDRGSSCRLLNRLQQCFSSSAAVCRQVWGQCLSYSLTMACPENPCSIGLNAIWPELRPGDPDGCSVLFTLCPCQGCFELFLLPSIS